MFLLEKIGDGLCPPRELAPRICEAEDGACQRRLIGFPTVETDLDVHTACSHMLDGVGHKPSRDVIAVTRVRRRQDRDLQRRLANTTGSARASATKP